MFGVTIFVVIQPPNCLTAEQLRCLIFEHELNKYWKTGADDMILDGVIINGFAKWKNYVIVRQIT